MQVTRRDFLKVSGTATTALTGVFSLAPVQARAEEAESRLKEAKQTTTVCPYCGCGCGQIVSSRNGKVINIEGDPDHPVNEGSLCSKGAALYQVANNDRRLKKVLYRAPRSNHWEEKSWAWAFDRISRNIQKTREAGLADGRGHNSIDTIAAMGGAALDNEECYLYSKFMRALGVRYVEHQARI